MSATDYKIPTKANLAAHKAAVGSTQLIFHPVKASPFLEELPNPTRSRKSDSKKNEPIEKIQVAPKGKQETYGSGSHRRPVTAILERKVKTQPSKKKEKAFNIPPAPNTTLAELVVPKAVDTVLTS